MPDADEILSALRGCKALVKEGVLTFMDLTAIATEANEFAEAVFVEWIKRQPPVAEAANESDEPQ